MREIRFLGVCGSPRTKGNSWFLLERAVESAVETTPVPVKAELYSLANKTYNPCDSCFTCHERGECRHQDDFQQLRDKWLAADAVVYSVPVYHMSVPGQLRCFLDRLGNSLPGLDQKYLKAVGVIAQGAHLFSGQEAAMLALIQHALIMGCVPISGDMWQSYIGAGGWTHGDGDRGALKKLLEDANPSSQAAVAAAASVGKRVAQLALLLKAGGDTYSDFLSSDDAYQAFLAAL